MKPEKKTDRHGNIYYKLGAVDGSYENGTQYRKYTTYYPDPGLSRSELERELRIRQSEWELKVRQMHDEERIKGVTREKRSQTFSDYVADTFLKTRIHKKKIKAGTVDNYQNYLDIRLNDYFGPMRISDITTASIDAFLSSLYEEGVRKGGGYAVPIVNLAPILKEKGMTRAAVAAQAGLSVDTVAFVVRASKDDSEKARFAIATVEKIAKVLGMPVEKLFCIERDMRPLADKTIRENYNLLHAIFAFAKDKGHISVNPMDAVDKPAYTPEKLPSHTEEEFLAILRAVMALPKSEFRWKVFVILLIATACRRAEIAGLQWKHIDFDAGIIIIEQQLVGTRIEKKDDKTIDKTKEKDFRPIKLDDDVLGMLKEYRDWYLDMRKSYILPDGTDMWRVGTTNRTKKLQKIFPAQPVDPDCLISENDFLFVQVGGFPGHPDSINTWMARFRKKNNLPPIHPHKFRHTVATELFDQELPTEVIAELLGHADSTVTERVYIDAGKMAKIRRSEALVNPFGFDYSKLTE